MYRDFSEKSRNELLRLVSQVENDKLSNFTDWVGDRWYDFESWIGVLNIKNYLNNVNEYHKKVIDKNNATKTSINTIFEKVKSVDMSYSNTFRVKGTQLQQYQKFIEELREIVNPCNGKFKADYISHVLEKSLDNIHEDELENFRIDLAGIIDQNNGNLSDLLKALLGTTIPSPDTTRSLALQLLMKNIFYSQNDDSSAGEKIKTGLNFLSKLNKNIGKYTENERVTLSSSVLGYLSTLCGIANSTESKTDIDIISDILSLFKAPIDVENSIYKYFEKTLHPYEVVKLDAKFGKVMTEISLLSGLIGTTDEGIDTYKVFIDQDSTAYDKAAQSIKMGGSVIDFGGKIYVASQARTKTLRFVDEAIGAKIESKLKFTTSEAVTKKIANVNMAVDLVDVGASTIASGIKQYGKVTADGELDWNDIGSVGVYGSLSGLDKVTSKLTLGLVNFDSEKVAGELETDVSDFVNSDSWAANYIRNKDNNVVLRVGVSVGAGAYMVGEKIVDGVVDCANTVGSWGAAGWRLVTHLL